MTADSCPHCSEPLLSPRPSTCPRCHYALSLYGGNPDQGMSTTGPQWPADFNSSADDPTRQMPVEEPSAPVRPVSPPPPITAPRPSLAERLPPGTARWVIAAASAAVVVLAIVVAAVVLRPQGPVTTADNKPSAATAPNRTAGTGSPVLTRIDAATIQASASSVLPPKAPVNYKAENTLDGDLTTAWNSDGTRSAGTRVTLTYSFAGPVELGRIELANGYQQDADTYARNRRIKSLTVTTDGAERTFDVADSMGYQPLNFDFGTTTKVVLRVVDTYPGDRFSDIAISEMVFHRIG